MARPHPALVELAAGRPLPPVPDTAALLASAREHRMVGLLRSQVMTGELMGMDLPEWVFSHDLVTRAHHRRLWATLDRLGQRLGDHGIEVAIMKGVAAEARWYDRQGERPCADLDLLIAPHHRHRVGRAVGLIQPDHPLRPCVQDLVERGLLQSVELETEDGTWIDLHVDALKLGVPSQRGLIWDRCLAVELPGDGRGTVRALDAETSFVHFLLHLTKDRFRFLLGFVDIAHILERESLDFAFVEHFVRAEGLEVHYASALDVVTSTLGLEPGTRARPTGVRAGLWRVVWHPSIRLQGELGVVRFRHRQVWIPLMARGRLRPALCFAARRLVPSPTLVEYRRPGAGRSWWRLNRERLGDAWRRRRAAAALRRGAVPGPGRGEAPNRGAG